MTVETFEDVILAEARLRGAVGADPYDLTASIAPALACVFAADADDLRRLSVLRCVLLGLPRMVNEQVAKRLLRVTWGRRSRQDPPTRYPLRGVGRSVPG